MLILEGRQRIGKSAALRALADVFLREGRVARLPHCPTAPLRSR
jgi:hypothetical protein